MVGNCGPISGLFKLRMVQTVCTRMWRRFAFKAKTDSVESLRTLRRAACPEQGGSGRERRELHSPSSPLFFFMRFSTNVEKTVPGEEFPT